MSLRLGDVTFDNVFYDEEADVLYLHVGDPRDAVEFGETPEGHGARYGADGSLVGVTIVNPRRLLESEGEVRVTLPRESSLDRAELAPVLG
jgi:uncharacterized protein YuzE